MSWPGVFLLDSWPPTCSERCGMWVFTKSAKCGAGARFECKRQPTTKKVRPVFASDGEDLEEKAFSLYHPYSTGVTIAPSQTRRTGRCGGGSVAWSESDLTPGVLGSPSGGCDCLGLRGGPHERANTVKELTQ